LAVADYPVQHRYFHWFGIIAWHTEGSTRRFYALSIMSRQFVFSAAAAASVENRAAHFSRSDKYIAPSELATTK